MEEQNIISDEETMIDGYCEIRLGKGRHFNIMLTTSEKYGNEFVQIQHLRSRDAEIPSKRFNVNKKNVRILGQGLIAFANANSL